MLEFWDLSTGSADPVANHTLPSRDKAAIADVMTWTDVRFAVSIAYKGHC